MKYRKIFLIFTGVAALMACTHKTKQNTVTTKYRERVFETEINQFGYDVYEDSTLIVHQPTIPVIQGNKAFASRDDAQRVAELVVYKLNNNVSPPSITISELDSLKIKK